jgi:hypothetical protein
MNAAASLDETTMKCGLLLETAQTQQELVATGLQQLREHTHGLDGIVRAEIRQTLIDELGEVVHESERAVETLRSLERRARLRFLLSTLVIAVLSGAMTAGAAWWLLPTSAEINALRSRRDQLAAELATLQRSGGLIDLRRCGGGQRWCVRVDRKAPAYGDESDYLVVKGY